MNIYKKLRRRNRRPTRTDNPKQNKMITESTAGKAKKNINAKLAQDGRAEQAEGQEEEEEKQKEDE